MSSNDPLSRREFLSLAAKLSALGLGAGALGGCTSPAAKEPSGSGAPQEEPRAARRAKVRQNAIDYRKARAVPTICFGCTTACGVIGWVQDGRVRKIDGNPLDPNTRGAICSKAQGMVSYTYYPERVLHPLKRVGPRGSGRWKRISWDEALDEVARRLKLLREGGRPEEFVFHYGRDKTKGFTKRFTNAFGTPHRLNRRSICSSNRRVPLMSFYGREFEWETQDLARSKFMINFGANPMEAYQGGLFMAPRIMEARVEHGAKLVTFEVRPSATASVSDEFYAITPASDGAIALAMAHVILAENLHDEAFWKRWSNLSLDTLREHLKPYTPEFAEAESGVPAADIRRIAIAFAKAAPACCTISNRGSAKHYNGVQADRAIRMLDVLVGNVGKPGGFCLSSLRMWKKGRYGQDGLPEISAPKPSPKGPAPWKPGTRAFHKLPKEVQARVRKFPEAWQNKYFGELATPSEFPLSWLYYSMRVGQLVYPYLKEERQQISVYMSYTLGAAFGFPEAKVAREVLEDENLIPFHVAIDIGYSEQASLADIILPDATSLERWDAHSQNSYALRPYTGIRQPLVEPLGEARPVQLIFQELARRIGGGMEKYFEFEDIEDYYKAWYSQLPISWEEFKARGIWTDPERPLDYELYEEPVPAEELEGSSVDEKTGVIRVERKGKQVAIGIMQEGKAVRGFPTPTRKIQVQDEIFVQAAQLTGLSLDDINASPLPVYDKVPEHKGLADDRLIFTTFKWNVHTQGRSGHWKYHAEIVHTNPALMHPETGAKFGLKEGDEVEITTYRPKGAVYRAGEEEPVGSFRQKVRFIPGMNRRVVACSHHVGHWEHGVVGRGGEPTKAELPQAHEGQLPLVSSETADKTPSLGEQVWWAKSKGGPGGGVHINDALPINAQPLVGGQNWFDNVCTIKKV
jgi:thiosulfate reductase / polysulfide reductase chain A